MDEIFAVLELAAEQRKKQLQAQRSAAPAAPAVSAAEPPAAVQPIASVSDAPALPDAIQAPQPQAVAAPSVAAAAAQRPAVRAERRHAPLQGMFEDGNTLIRAVIASEVLGPPRALRGENALWSLQPNEP